MLRVVFPHKALNCFILHQFDVFHRVGGDKAVHADHHRQTDIPSFRNGEGLDIVVIDLLIVLRVDLDPAGVPGTHGVGMVIVDVDGAGESAGGHCQNNGQSGGCRHIQKLIHQSQTCGGSGADGPASRSGSADADGHGAVLGFHGDKLRIYLTVRHILGKILGDLCGRGDGECAHDIGVDLAHGNGNGLVAGKSVENGHYSSSFHTMASKGQAVMQTPQPLQCIRSNSPRLPSFTGIQLSGQ